MRPSHGGVGGRDGPLADCHERAQVSDQCIVWTIDNTSIICKYVLFVMSLVKESRSLYSVLPVTFVFSSQQGQENPHHHPQVPSWWQLWGLGLRRAHHYWLNPVCTDKTSTSADSHTNPERNLFFPSTVVIGLWLSREPKCLLFVPGFILQPGQVLLWIQGVM